MNEAAKAVYAPLETQQDRVRLLQVLSYLATDALHELIAPAGIALWRRAMLIRQPEIAVKYLAKTYTVDPTAPAEELVSTFKQALAHLGTLLYPRIRDIEFENCPEQQELTKYIVDWQRRHHLGAKWMYVAADNTLARTWYCDVMHQYADWELSEPAFTLFLPNGATLLGGRPETSDGFLSPLGLTALSEGEAQLWKTSLQDWTRSFLDTCDPRLMGKKEWVAAGLAGYETFLAGIYDDVQLADELNFGSTKESQKESLDHFEWFVRFQVLMENPGEIALSLNPDATRNVTRKIDRAIDDVSRRTHIPRRRRKLGRPFNSGRKLITATDHA